MSERVLEFEEALGEVLRSAEALGRPPQTESAGLLETVGRTLAAPVKAERDQPPFPRSTRDGYAVRSVDVSSEQPLRIVGGVRAGEQWTGDVLGNCEAIEIMTGAPVPEGADAVLMVEHASIGPDGALEVQGGRTLQPGENVVAQGAEAHAGAALVPVGRRIGAPEIAVAANCGCERLEVFAKPVVAIVATGDELVGLDEQPQPWQIRNSNSYALAALVTAQGGEPRRLPIARDKRDHLQQSIAGAMDAQLLLLSGGVSMGKYDLVEQVLSELGAEFLFTGAWIQPGKPVVFGRLPRRSKKEGQEASGPADESASGSNWLYFFGLPGNPISTEVCFRLFAAPMLRALTGQTDIAPQFAEALLAEEVRGGARVTRFLPAIIESDWKQASVRVVPWRGSGDLAANARANGFAVLPGGAERIVAGESVRVLLR